MIEYVFLFDENKPGPDIQEILLYTLLIIVISNIIFLIVCKLLGLNPNNSIDIEKQHEFESWKKKGISVGSLLVSEVLNTSLYSPIAEELVFRLFLMKFLLTRKLNLNQWLANSIQAITFGLIHITNNTNSTQTKNYTNLQTISATISGFVSGWAYIKSNSILPCLFAHIINNGVVSISEVIGYYNYLKTNN